MFTAGAVQHNDLGPRPPSPSVSLSLSLTLSLALSLSLTQGASEDIMRSKQVLYNTMTWDPETASSVSFVPNYK